MTDATPALPSAEAKRIVREGYDRVSYAYRADTCELEQSGYGHWLRRLFRRVPPGSRVLDLGCGCGVPVTQELAKRHVVTGVDLSPVQIERARTLVPGATFVCADMTDVRFEPGAFDAVVAFYSIINVPVGEQPALFGRIAEWLVPGGWLLAILGKEAWTGIERDWRGVAGATMYWSHASITRYREWLGAAGFTRVEEGTQPEDGSPGFAVVIARRPS